MFKLFKNLSYIWNKFTKAGDDFWDLLEEELILGNISFETVNYLINQLREYSFKENISDPAILKNRLKEYILDILQSGENNTGLNISPVKPSVFLIVGVNGVGKTSSIAKLANLLANDKKLFIISVFPIPELLFLTALTKQLQKKQILLSSILPEECRLLQILWMN